jgi:hypothetical protein
MFIDGFYTQKMRIAAYRDSQYPKGGEIKTFDVQINPETITRSMSLNYSGDVHPGSAQPAVYFNTAPEEFTVDILFDGTGAVTNAGPVNAGAVGSVLSLINDVSSQIKKLKDCLYYVDGERHRPNFIAVFYGTDDITFYGVLTSLNIDYKLFSPTGNPLRAIAHLSLKSSIDVKDSAAEQNASSPDLTHQRIFKADSQFTLMSNDIYNDVNRYIDVAKANKLLSFRKIKTGTVINFPPIK